MLGSDEQGDSGVFEESGVREVRFPSTLVEIGCAAFQSCERLKSVMLPDGLQRIGTNAFCGSGLEAVAFPPGLRSVGSGAFTIYTKLCSAELNEGLEELGDDGDELSDEYGVFQESGIEEVTLPKTLREAGPYAFADCEGLSTISVEEGCAACLYREGMPEMTIVQSLSATLTGDKRLLGLRGPAQVVIPDGAERVCNHWFWDSVVEEVLIPASVQEIGAQAFYGC